MSQRGFTMLELLFSVLVFSIGVLAYLQYQSHASAVLFDTESSIIANQLAVELAEEVNSMSEDSFAALVDTITQNLGTNSPTAWKPDNDLRSYASAGGQTLLSYSAGPFTEFGKPMENISGNGYFYRLFRLRTYNEMSNTANDIGTPLEILRIIEILVAWPKKDYPTIECNMPPLSGNCNSLTVTVIKPLI